MQKSSRRGWLTPVLSHHRTYRSVYGGSACDYSFTKDKTQISLSTPNLPSSSTLFSARQFHVYGLAALRESLDLPRHIR